MARSGQSEGKLPGKTGSPRDTRVLKDGDKMVEKLKSEQKIQRPGPQAFDVALMWHWRGVAGLWGGHRGDRWNHGHGGAAAAPGGPLDPDDRVQQGPALQAPPPTWAHRGLGPSSERRFGLGPRRSPVCSGQTV